MYIHIYIYIYIQCIYVYSVHVYLQLQRERYIYNTYVYIYVYIWQYSKHIIIYMFFFIIYFNYCTFFETSRHPAIQPPFFRTLPPFPLALHGGSRTIHSHRWFEALPCKSENIELLWAQFLQAAWLPSMRMSRGMLRNHGCDHEIAWHCDTPWSVSRAIHTC